MDYQTVNSRSIIIPELAITLHLHSMELPGSIAQAADDRNSAETDRLLVELCQEVFRLGRGEIISFSEWSHATVQVLKALDSFRPSEETSPAYAAAQNDIVTIKNRFKTPGDYLERLITNGLLVPRRQRVKNPGLQWFDGVTSSDKSAPEFFAKLAVSGVFELNFANWYGVNQLIYPQPYPSAASARQQVPEFQIPVAGSKPIRAITIQNFQKLCYGAAALVIGETALSTAATLGHGQAPVIAAVLGGSASALIFASVGSLSRYLEDYLKSKSSTQSETPTPRTTTKARTAAA